MFYENKRLAGQRFGPQMDFTTAFRQFRTSRGPHTPLCEPGHGRALTHAVAPDFSMLSWHNNIDVPYQDGHQRPVKLNRDKDSIECRKSPELKVGDGSGATMNKYKVEMIAPW